jgi:hypothetical protein
VIATVSVMTLMMTVRACDGALRLCIIYQ